VNVPTELLGELPTPCLLVDEAAASRNIERCAATVRNGTARLRPHFKAHKCSRLLRKQVAAGECAGVTCQTSWEALALARAGFSDILIANEIVDRSALKEVAEAARMASVTIVVDAPVQVELAAGLDLGPESSLGVLIELDVGTGRCGLPVGSPELVPLARAIARARGLVFLGLQAYEGHAVLREDRELRRVLVWQAAQQAKFERERLEMAGFECRVISGGGTGTVDLAVETGVLTEIQAGSYVLMDARYAGLGLPFETALYCVTTLVSRRAPEAGVLNAGLKELTVEHGMPQSCTLGVSVIALSDEHACVRIDRQADLSVGDNVLLIPSHIDPTINLWDTLFVWTGDSMERWRVDGRRSFAVEEAYRFASEGSS
jgi:D-serine deaminase-like pyridoxal phosphate-dependent protein